MKRLLLALICLGTFIFTGTASASKKQFTMTGNFDGDGLTDTVIATINLKAGTIRWDIALSSDTETHQFFISNTDFSAFYISDWNHDGTPDLIGLRQPSFIKKLRVWGFNGVLLGEKSINKSGLNALINGALAKTELFETGGTGGLLKYCPKIREIQSGEIWKSEASDHISGSDPRKYSTSLIFLHNKSSPSPGCLYVYDKLGKLVHSLGVYARAENLYSARFYGGSGCGDKKAPGLIAQQARTHTGSPEVFVDYGPLCVRIPDPSKRAD